MLVDKKGDPIYTVKSDRALALVIRTQGYISRGSKMDNLNKIFNVKHCNNCIVLKPLPPSPPPFTILRLRPCIIKQEHYQISAVRPMIEALSSSNITLLEKRRKL